VGRPPDDRVPDLAQAGGDGDVEEVVAGAAVVTGKDSDGRPALGLGPATGGFHHTAEPAAHDDGTTTAQLPAHVLCEGDGIGGRLTTAHDGDVRSFRLHGGKGTDVAVAESLDCLQRMRRAYLRAVPAPVTSVA